MSFVKSMPRVFDWAGTGPVVRWLNDTRFAFRLAGAGGLPSNGEFFALGGGDRFRGFDVGERQGNAIWVGSAEWRVPLLKTLDWDICDHTVGVRNIYLAPFYDVGDAYLKNQSFGDVAQAVGLGLRVDMVWLGMIERTMFRFDVARTLTLGREPAAQAKDKRRLKRKGHHAGLPWKKQPSMARQRPTLGGVVPSRLQAQFGLMPK